MDGLSCDLGAWPFWAFGVTSRRLHRALALGLGLFIALHLGNHLAGLWGQDRHGAVQTALRIAYRSPLVEAALLAAFALQIGLGLVLLGWRRRMSLQTVSGAYLGGFLTIHIAAVMAARWQGIDTDLAFAAAGLHAPAPWPLILAPYYGLAVLAIFAHVSIPISRRHRFVGHLALGLGAVVAVILVLLLAGVWTPLAIPAPLIAAFP